MQLFLTPVPRPDHTVLEAALAAFPEGLVDPALTPGTKRRSRRRPLQRPSRTAASATSSGAVRSKRA
jgi:hypothetical protein